MLERYCDALIIGTDLSGLITAAFLARRGLTVHVLDLDPFATSSKEPDPFVVASLHSKLLRSILGRLNVPETDIQFLSGTDSPLQIIFPRKRLDISSNPLTFYEELKREFPSQFDRLKSFYESLAHIKHQVETQQLYALLMPQTFGERRALMKFVKTHGLDQRLSDLGLPLEAEPEIRNFLMAQLKLITYTHTQSPFAFQVAELLNPTEGEVLSIHGGHHYLRKLFLDRIQHHEGAYRPDAKIETLLFKNGIFEGARLAGSEGNILARYVIWNTHLKKLTDYLPEMFRFRKLKRSIESLKPAWYWFTARFSVPQKFIPAPMKDNLILIQNPEDTLKGANFLYVQVKDRQAEVPTLTVSYLMEPEYLEKEFDAFSPIHEKIIQALKKLLPFSQDHLVQTFPLPNNTQEETLFPMKENDFEIFKQTVRMHPIYNLDVKSFPDLFPITYRTPAPNFFLTAPEIFGTMGYEGKYMLGLKVTDIIWNDVEKAKKRAMKTERRIA